MSVCLLLWTGLRKKSMVTGGGVYAPLPTGAGISASVNPEEET